LPGLTGAARVCPGPRAPQASGGCLRGTATLPIGSRSSPGTPCAYRVSGAVWRAPRSPSCASAGLHRCRPGRPAARLPGLTGAARVCPGPRAPQASGGCLRGTATLPTGADGRSRVSAGDLAVAVLDALETPGPERHFTLAEAGRRPGAT
ncbi:hypothetical protein ACFC0P_44070, partial [Streptomyces broussonetiae]